MRVFLLTAIVLLAVFPQTGRSQSDSTGALYDQPAPAFMPNEISLGVGAATSMEKDMFNVPNDVSAGTNVGIQLVYLRNVDEHLAFGIDMYGYFKSVGDATLTVNGNTKNVTLEVSTLNIGAIGRYIFNRDKLQPYAFLVLSYLTGSLSNDELGRLNMNGFTGGGGLGLNISLGEQFAISFEGLASFGTAKWEQPPFTNSTGDEYDPSMIMFQGKFTYLWE